MFFHQPLLHLSANNIFFVIYANILYIMHLKPEKASSVVELIMSNIRSFFFTQGLMTFKNIYKKIYKNV